MRALIATKPGISSDNNDRRDQAFSVFAKQTGKYLAR